MLHVSTLSVGHHQGIQYIKKHVHTAKYYYCIAWWWHIDKAETCSTSTYIIKILLCLLGENTKHFLKLQAQTYVDNYITDHLRSGINIFLTGELRVIFMSQIFKVVKSSNWNTKLILPWHLLIFFKTVTMLLNTQPFCLTLELRTEIHSKLIELSREADSGNWSSDHIRTQLMLNTNWQDHRSRNEKQEPFTDEKDFGFPGKRPYSVPNVDDSNHEALSCSHSWIAGSYPAEGIVLLNEG